MSILSAQSIRKLDELTEPSEAIPDIRDGISAMFMKRARESVKKKPDARAYADAMSTPNTDPTRF